MKKVISKEYIGGLQDLGINKDSMYQEEMPNKISEQMVQHLSHESESSLYNGLRLKKEGVIEGKTDG